MYAELKVEFDSNEINFQQSSNLQGVLMENISSEYAEKLHGNQLNPYPIAAIAQETGAMESESKRMPKKNAVTIMEDGERHLVEEDEEEKEISDGTYSWEEFDQEVIQEKYRALSEFFEDLEDRGMAFLYRMLELVRGHEEKINFARMMYLLSRLEPSEEGPKKEKYRQLSKKMYEWIQSDQDCRQLKTAINLYAYMNRKGEGKDED